MYVRLNRCLLHRLDCLQGRQNEHTPYIQFKKAGAVYKMVSAPVVHEHTPFIQFKKAEATYRIRSRINWTPKSANANLDVGVHQSGVF